MKLKFDFSRPTWLVAIVALIFGLVLAIAPGLSTTLIITVVCGGAIAIGALYMGSFLIRKTDSPWTDTRLATGTVLVALGITGIVLRRVLVSAIPWVFGVILFVTGIAKMQRSLNMRRMHYGNWWYSLLSAGISVVLGLLIITHPFGVGLMAIRVIGISIAVEAIQDLAEGINYKHAIHMHFTD